MKFWLYVFITAVLEIAVSYAIYMMLFQRGYIYTFRIPVGTDYLSFSYILLFISSVCSAISLGTLKEKDNGEVLPLFRHFLSYIKHPVTLGSVLLFLFSFLFL
jgi:hypothetical protein